MLHEAPEIFTLKKYIIFILKKYIIFLTLKSVFCHCITIMSQQSHLGSKREERKITARRKLIHYSCEPIFITTHCKALSEFLG